MRIPLNVLRKDTGLTIEHLIAITPHAHRVDEYVPYNTEPHFWDLETEGRHVRKSQTRCPKCTLMRIAENQSEQSDIDVEIDIRLYWRTYDI